MIITRYKILLEFSRMLTTSKVRGSKYNQNKKRDVTYHENPTDVSSPFIVVLLSRCRSITLFRKMFDV